MNLLENYTKRLQGIVSPSFCTKSILFVGVGAGSYMAEKLARLAPRELRLLDHDYVEVSNLSRTAYTFEDAAHHRPKVEALADRIRAINPLVNVVPLARNVVHLSETDDFFTGVDLVVAGTDNLEAQAHINTIAVQRGIPAVFIGIHALAQGGRIIWTLPGMPCYRCVARERFENPDDNNLAGAAGAIFDCQSIDMHATRIAVGILERDQSSLMGLFFRGLGGRNDIVVRCSTGYAWGNQVWDALLADLPSHPKRYAEELRDYLVGMDCLGFKTSYDPSCPVCPKGA